MGAVITISPCFARCALPYGGFEKASQFMKFQMPEPEATKQEQEPTVVYQHDIGCRPSFNRTPIGWMGSNEPSSIHMESDAVPFDGETDELWKNINSVITLTGTGTYSRKHECMHTR